MKMGIFGSSGMARETADICRELDYEEIVLIDIVEHASHNYFGYKLVREKDVYELNEQGFQFIIGIGENRVRKKIYERFPELNYVTIVHPSATFGYGQRNEVDQSKGNIIAAGCRFTNNIKVGNFGIFNSNCTIAHDCIIGDFVSVAPGANISGNVHLSSGSQIGAGSVIIQGKSIEEKVVIGEFATVGAGAVVTRSVSGYVTVKGIPAK